tara:strand:- start:86 stop:604 length:519 start_codon:yes stop_codon:yes gene_type:complete
MAKDRIPLYGQQKEGSHMAKAHGKIIYNDGATALSLAPQDSGISVVITGGTNGAAACSIPSALGQDGLEYHFYLKAANGTGDYDIDAEDGVGFFIGSIDSLEGTSDVGIDFNGSSHDQLTLAASKGAAGDQVHIFSAGGKWYVRGTTNDQDGWAVGTASANSSVPTDSNTPL